MSAIWTTALRARSMTAPRMVVAPLRSYHITPAVRYAYKDSQDRESLKPSGTENSKSGRDSDIASNNPDAAFNPSKTSPEEAQAAGGSDIEFSGVNQDMSKPQGDEKDVKKQGGQGKEMEKGGKSGGNSPPKKG
ncbi:hypothetical protein F5X68DRAFT_263821 [Plectosphaerella plurivora]|uniref:Uncharacterized protein n=1 Tax=Plectosphaerella plurivora TaxID=936078 RepID=A0A9P8V680_9PEZI|nr:hypothetical protein F5X68DRAFT_263821 [Plectosphaerella plurivora]